MPRQSAVELVKLSVVTLVGAVALSACSTDDCPKSGDCGSAERAQASPRLARLTHAQWANTVVDLFEGLHLPSFAQTFRSDPRENGALFDNNADSLSVDQALWQAYQRAATQIAAHAAGDGEFLAKWAPDEGSVSARGEALIRAFGERVYRRPLDVAELESYRALFVGAREVFPDRPQLEAGAELVIQAMLQSPHFLYRVEDTAKVSTAEPLSSYERASRLSYALWDTMPDSSLLDKAASGALDDAETVADEARRLLDSSRAEPVLQRLHYQLLYIDRYRSISRYPEEALPDMAAEENRLFLRHTILEESGTLSDLLTSTKTFANTTLAALYGLSGDFTDEYQLVELDPTQRSGIFTQIGFLASNANSGVPDPIHRGAFLARRIACMNVPMPPPNIPPVPAAEGRTNRETVAAHTEAPDSVCEGCHSVFINPLGFPFEYYDGLGRYRTEDNGHPVDGSSSLALEGKPRVNNALDVAQALADSPEVHRCYAKHLLEFTFGRLTADGDDALVAQVAQASQADQQPIKQLVVQLVASPGFLSRTVEVSQ
jgi:Protein of unknown function (DUF1592)/Protein of unknown function (DUF1588)/Protein of unknown function (DUF1587)/Protein of unknown function (DUF1595)/Protein of unknown function (DUF1585)